MPKELALLICLGFTGGLLLADLRQRRAGSWALLVPGIWLAIIASRPPARWFNPATVTGIDTTATGEAGFANLLVEGTLMLAALVILKRRSVDWRACVSDNKALLLLYAYYAASAVWSPDPMSCL
jgi:hypothetical protein